MPTALLNDAELYYEDHGDGPAIVFNHGGGLSHVDFFQQVPFFLAHGFRCVTFDQRGHGLSPAVEAGTPAAARAAEQGLDVFANDTRALMDHLGIGDAVVVGMSMGGWNASRLALTHPARVRGLVMIGSSFGLPTTAQQEWARWMIGQIEAGVDPVVAERSTPQQQRFRAQHPELAFLRDELAALFPAHETGRGTGHRGGGGRRRAGAPPGRGPLLPLRAGGALQRRRARLHPAPALIVPDLRRLTEVRGRSPARSSAPVRDADASGSTARCRPSRSPRRS